MVPSILPIAPSISTLTSVEKINLVTTFMSTICKVTTKTSIQYVILPFIY